MRFLAGRVDDIKRHARHIGDHDGAVRGLPFDLGRARIGVRLWPGVACGEQFRRHFRHHITVFGVDHGDGAQFGQAVEGGEKLIIIHHQRALVGEEVLEGIDAPVLHDGFHVVEDLLPPPCDRHVEGIVAVRAGRFVVPALDRVEQAFALIGQAEIDNHRGAARQSRPRAGLKVIAGVGAHERHLQMHMRVDPAGHDVATGRVQLLIAFQVGADLDDPACVDQDIRLVGQIMRDDGAVLDDFGHVCLRYGQV